MKTAITTTTTTIKTTTKTKSEVVQHSTAQIIARANRYVQIVDLLTQINKKLDRISAKEVESGNYLRIFMEVDRLWLKIRGLEQESKELEEGDECDGLGRRQSNC